ncbi:UDP-glucose:sterol glycosyltransferase [Histoplasma capsulatum H143]|uniref:UDP-glucose:sterol glycosyltransferase n=1 Tax=Ajellomyces capsulatus (strain H143) TaxID=544712 RepID=C6H747_AJECH|nr:UDP-glucose:sterol glycosyltransferase [Histoplasma capsulatum H143]
MQQRITVERVRPVRVCELGSRRSSNRSLGINSFLGRVWRILVLGSEDGVATAIQAIYRDLEYAKTLVRQRSPTTSAPQTAIYAVSNEESAAMISSETGPDDDGDGEDDADADAAMEDSWTFVGDETETDVTKKTRARERDYDIRLDNVATAGVINGSGGYGSDSGKG